MTNTIVDSEAIEASNLIVEKIMAMFPVENTTTFPYTVCASCRNFTEADEVSPDKCTKNPSTATIGCPAIGRLQYSATQIEDGIYPDPEGEDIPF